MKLEYFFKKFNQREYETVFDVNGFNLLTQKKIIEEITINSFVIDEETKLYKYNQFFKKIHIPLAICNHCLVEHIDEIKDCVDKNEGIPEKIILKLCEAFDRMVMKWFVKNLYNDFYTDLDESIEYEKSFVNSLEVVITSKLNELMNSIPDVDLNKFGETIKGLNSLKPKQRQLIEKSMAYNDTNAIKEVVKENNI